MEIRNVKKINYKRIYSQIVKYGKTIPELAVEYGMDEKSFMEKIQMGMDAKLFNIVVKNSEKRIKQQKINSRAAEKVTKQKENAKKTDMSIKDKKDENIKTLESKKLTIIRKIRDQNEKLKESNQILAFEEERVTAVQKIFNSAMEALEEAKRECNNAKSVIEQNKQSIKNLKDRLVSIEKQIIELKNKYIYLVAPGYTGKKPEYGTYYSTTKVQGFETLSVVETLQEEYAIEPEIKDMVIAGYDSYREYMEGLRFTMLCVEYTLKGIEYEVLVSDERLKRLLKTHVG